MYSLHQNSKNNKYFVFITLLSMFLFNCKDSYNPWGLWNKYNNPIDGEDIKIRSLRSGNYYEIALGGLYITKHGDELFKIFKNTSIMAIQGEYTKIEKYEVISDGYIFYLVGVGFKHTSEGPIFQDDTHIKVKMHFINNDECYFEYVSREDGNGFHLSYFPEENLIYRRFRIK